MTAFLKDGSPQNDRHPGHRWPCELYPSLGESSLSVLKNPGDPLRHACTLARPRHCTRGMTGEPSGLPLPVHASAPLILTGDIPPVPDPSNSHPKLAQEQAGVPTSSMAC